MKGILTILGLTLMVLSYSSICAQGFRDLEKGTGKSDAQKKDSLDSVQDSFEISIQLKSVKFDLENIFDTIPFQDTMLSDNFPYFNPLEALDYPVIDKGYIGSSSMPLTGYVFQPGFDLGFHRFDMYQKKANIYHINNIAFSDLYFSPGANVQEFSTAAIFSRNFKDVTLDIDYARVNNIGKYVGQTNKHTDVNLGLWKGNLESRFNTFFNFKVNVDEENDNGGVVDTSYLYNSTYRKRVVVPVNLTDAISRKENFDIFITEYYRLFEKGTYLGFKPYLVGKLGLSKGFYKFYDKDVKNDSLIYGKLLADEIGLRSYIKTQNIHSNLALFGISDLGCSMKLGIDYKRWKYNIEPNDDEIANQFQIYSNGRINFVKGFSADWNSKLFLGDFRGDLDAILGFNFENSNFLIKTGASVGRYSPTLLSEKLYLTGQKIYENSFNKISKLGYFASVKLKKLGLYTSLKNERIKDYIYFSKELLPVQHFEDIILTTFNIREHLKLYIFHLDANVFIFNSTSDKIPIPVYTLQSKLYVEGAPNLLNNNMFIKTGFEFNYWDKYYNYGFNPAIGNFYVQNDIKWSNYMRLDYFLSAKVSKFLFFVRFNNLLYPLNKFKIPKKIEVPFKTLNYPQSDMFWRMGVKWVLVN